MTKRYDIAVVGEIFQDHIFTGFAQWPRPGDEVFAKDYVREIGGGAAITSCALARLGRNVAVVGAIGKSDAWTRKRLDSFGIALDGLKDSEQDTAVTASVSTREDRSFFTWAGSNRELPGHLAAPHVQKILAASRHVHFAMRLERSLASQLFPLLRHSGCRISIDPGFHTDWYAESKNLATLSECDYSFPNEKEGELMTGCSQPQAIMAKLLALGITSPVLKLGSRGAVAASNDALLFAVPPLIGAIDTTGAGDAFDAGFIHSIWDDPSLERALRYGCACGALSTRSTGGIASLPGKSELETMYKQVAMKEDHVE